MMTPTMGIHGQAKMNTAQPKVALHRLINQHFDREELRTLCFELGVEYESLPAEGKTARDGIKPVNVSGGLKCKGHPVGATGSAQIVEIFEQMRGSAGARQVTGKDINLALTHNIGAHGTTAVVQIYERRQ